MSSGRAQILVNIVAVLALLLLAVPLYFAFTTSGAVRTCEGTPTTDSACFR